MIDKPNGSRQILVVDDESIICGVIAKGLAFFRFAHANNGKAALEIIEKARPCRWPEAGVRVAVAVGIQDPPGAIRALDRLAEQAGNPTPDRSGSVGAVGLSAA